MRLHNTLTKKVEEFTPREDNTVQMFVCGPTVYDFSHLGHAKTYILFDVLARVLRANNYDVFYLQNITDIDDKIIQRANEQGIDWQELRSTYQTEYEKDMASLNITSVSQYARATDYIDDIIRQVQTLIDKGHAYVIDGDGIYFEIATFPEYGKLSGRTEVKENDAQSRIDESSEKRGWNDFALWKFSKPGEPVWDARFTIGDASLDGKGRPGWHIEDTAISEHFFGPQYDLHGGAIDLIFPHHEAEITQMESASGLKPFVKYWVHTGFLNVDDQKMSKSLHNFYTIREVLEKGYDPLAVRLFMLQTHYRSPINFTFDSLDGAVNRLKNWRNVAALRHQIHDTFDAEEAGTDERAEWLYGASQAITEALGDDLNTAEALKIIDDAFSKVSGAPLEDIHETAFKQLLETIDDVLGLKLLDTTPDLSDEQKMLILERERARDAKDWDKSDKLRDELARSGIAINDSPSGSVWQYAN